MLISERHQLILSELQNDPNVSVAKLAKKLYVSEPTIRRDLTELHNKGIITKIYGGAVLNTATAFREMPFYLREKEKSQSKTEMGRAAASYIRDGMVLMLDGSTSAYHIVPYLTKFNNLTVITSGAKTAVALAEANIRTFCTGGQMIIHSYSYVGRQAEEFVRNINADLLLFSCRGLDENGNMTDNAIEEANLRQVMMDHAKTKILLCDSSKIGHTYFYNMGSIRSVQQVISDKPLPQSILDLIPR